MQVFLAHYSGESSVAEDIADHLTSTFSEEDLGVFLSSNWESVSPGVRWQDKVITSLEESKALLALMSVDSLGRPWLNFEIGVAWAKRMPILLLCHRGLTPGALPSPYNTIQAVDLNNKNHEDQLDEIAKALAMAIDLTVPREVPLRPVLEEGATPFSSGYRAWSLRPGAHIGETLEGTFLVGSVNPAYAERASAAALPPTETLFVKLFVGATAEGRYIPVMVSGEGAGFFETVPRDTVRIKARLRLMGSHVVREGEPAIPLIAVDSHQVVDGV